MGLLVSLSRRVTWLCGAAFSTMPCGRSASHGRRRRRASRRARRTTATTPWTARRDCSERRGLSRFVDQPTITAAEGEVWLVFNGGGPIVATGAPVTGLGKVGTFITPEVVPGTNNCTYGDVAIGPSGQVMQVCTLTESGQGGGKLFVNVDPDGLGPAGFGEDRKSTRLNSSHSQISYAVFCLKKKKTRSHV